MIAAGAQHGDPVAHGLDLAQDVRGEQHGLPAIARLPYARAEHLLHEWIEPGRRLVEQEQVGPGRERGDQQDLLPVAVAVRADLLVGRELEAVDELGAVCLVD